MLASAIMSDQVPEESVPVLLALAREAIAHGDDSSPTRRGLGILLLRSGEPREGLAALAPLLRDPEVVRSHPSGAQADVIRLAAAGLVRETLDVLVDAPSALRLEPLVVALRLELGETVDAPVEVLEVARDVIARIHAAARPTPEPPPG